MPPRHCYSRAYELRRMPTRRSGAPAVPDQALGRRHSGCRRRRVRCARAASRGVIAFAAAWGYADSTLKLLVVLMAGHGGTVRHLVLIRAAFWRRSGRCGRLSGGRSRHGFRLGWGQLAASTSCRQQGHGKERKKSGEPHEKPRMNQLDQLGRAGDPICNQRTMS